MPSRVQRLIVPSALIFAIAAASPVHGGPAAGPDAGGDQLWLARYEGPGMDDDVAVAVAPSPDGSAVYVTGFSDGSGGDADYATISYDSSTGTKRWVRRFDGPSHGSDAAADVLSGPDGTTVFVTGTSEADFATIAYDAAGGATTWIRRYDGPADGADTASAIAGSPDGTKVFVTGRSDGNDGSSDYATVAYDASTGALLWARRYQGPASGTDAPATVVASPDGSRVFVTGLSVGTSNDFATVAYDASTGAPVWARRYNGPADANDSAQSLVASPDGSTVFVTGYSSGPNRNDSITIAFSAATGAMVWLRRYDGPANHNDEANAVAISPDGSTVVVTGYSIGAETSADFLTIAYDSGTGADRWVRRYDAPGPLSSSDVASNMAISPDGSTVLVTGYSVEQKIGFATVAYAAASGAVLWATRFEAPTPLGESYPFDLAVDPASSRVFVTGDSTYLTQIDAHYLTIAYEL